MSLKQAVEQVNEFHVKSNQVPHGFAEGDYTHPSRVLRRRLIEEEYNEYMLAEKQNDIVKVADGLADLIYVIIGAAIEYNIPITAVFNEVQRSNMTKFRDGYLREDGKFIKGPLYEPPRIKEILEGKNPTVVTITLAEFGAFCKQFDKDWYFEGDDCFIDEEFWDGKFDPTETITVAEGDIYLCYQGSEDIKENSKDFLPEFKKWKGGVTTEFLSMEIPKGTGKEVTEVVRKFLEGRK